MATNDSYQETVSKMARKYSQYRLPDPSELLESDGDDNDTTPNLNSNRNPTDTSTHSLNLSSEPSNISTLEHDEDEEDEDLFSETNTMISHKSYTYSSSNKHAHVLRKTSSQGSLTAPNHKARKTSKVHFGPTTHYNPLEEIREIQTDKALFIDIFDKYFDESKEGDVDFSEFKKGLSKLGHTGTDQHINKLFNILLMNGTIDGDENDAYLQSDQFSDFLTRKFENSQLIAFQELLLNIIIPNTKKNDDRHRLITADDSGQWDAAEVSLAEAEMRQAMEQMVDSEMEKLNKISEFQEELQRRVCDPQFCKESNAENWDCYEVAHWVDTNGYNYCMKRFFDAKIDGNVLLYDMNVAMLVSSLGVTSIHSNKFMRNVNELRQTINANKTILTMDYGICDVYIESKSDENAMQSMKFENKMSGLNARVLELENEKKVLNDKVIHLQIELNETEERYLQTKTEIVSLKQTAQMNSVQLTDYENMKGLYDNISQQLNDSKNEIQNTKHTHESRMELLKKQFNEQTQSFKQEITKLTKMNDSLSDENVQLKSAVSNPQKTEEQKCDDFETKNCLNWSSAEVGHWLSTIAMKKYVSQFVEMEVDGQILLHDLNRSNLISDLCVKSIHAPKLIRGITELKNEINFEENNAESVIITEAVTSFTIPPTENELMNKLKTDLSEARNRLEALVHNKNKMNLENENMNAPPMLSPQSSIFSNYTINNDGTLLYDMHSRNESNSTAFTQYSEGNKTVSELQKYVKYLEMRVSELETKNKELSTLFYRADKNCKEYSTQFVPFQQRIRGLEAQNQKRKETIDKLSKRILRRNETIKRLKQTQLQHNLTSTYGHNVGPSMTMGQHSSMQQTTMHRPMSVVSGYSSGPRKHTHAQQQNSGNYLSHQNLMSHQNMSGISGGHTMHGLQPSVISKENSGDGSIFGSIYGYIMGDNATPGQN